MFSYRWQRCQDQFFCLEAVHQIMSCSSCRSTNDTNRQARLTFHTLHFKQFWRTVQI